MNFEKMALFQGKPPIIEGLENQKIIIPTMKPLD